MRNRKIGLIAISIAMLSIIVMFYQNNVQREHKHIVLSTLQWIVLDFIWFIAQFVYSWSVTGWNEKHFRIAERLEQWSLSYQTIYDKVDNNTDIDAKLSLLRIQTLFLSCSKKKDNQHNEMQDFYCIDWFPGAGDSIDIRTLKQLGMDLSRPIYFPNLTSYFHHQSNSSINQVQPLSLTHLSSSPFGDMDIQYFSDSRNVGALKPNSIASLREIIQNVTQDVNSTIKIGTQKPIETYPFLIETIAPNDIVTAFFGKRFQPDDVKPYLGVLPPLTTVPIFLARGLQIPDNQKNVRTDLHCEPIGNIAIQLEGSKKWTLVHPKYSRLLQPTISKHGRAFFYSKLNPINNHYLHDIPHYEIITNNGDGLWIPPWTWHRVDYIPETVSLAASLFHFRPWEFVVNNPLFAISIVPNLFKELFGWKTE